MIVLPLLVLQVSIGILIVQRYFDLVTKQLSNAVIVDLRFLEAHSQNETEFANFLGEYEYYIVDPSTVDPSYGERLTHNEFGFADLSGRYILQSFRSNFGDEVYIDSAHGQLVYISVPTRFGVKTIKITRSKLAPVNPHQILLNTTLFSVIVLVIVFMFLRNQVRSIRQLSRAAEAFGRGETLEYVPTGASEIRLAGRNFLKMRARINRQRAQRNLMLSGVSHDLRTPLTRFKLSLELIDDQHEKEAMIKDVEDMEMLIDSFLKYASNTATDEREEINLRDFLKGIQKEEPEVKLGNIPDISISAKPFLLRRAILNLVHNAKNHGENIELSAEKKRRVLEITIDDDGPGIAPEDRELAVTAFKRLDHARNQNEGAHAGLGLAISDDAIRQHGGELMLEKAPIGGLRAVISLPLAPPPSDKSKRRAPQKHV